MLNNFAAFLRLLDYSVQPFHKEWADFVQSNPRSLLLAPRGHGKSTLMTVAFALWKLARNPNASILIVSNTADMAMGFIVEMQQHCTDTEAPLLRLFPWLGKGNKWTDKQFSVRGRTMKGKERSVVGMGVGGSIISKHYDYLLVDDIVDEENVATEYLRNKLHTWFFKSLMPTLRPAGEIHIAGTRYHHADFYSRLMGKEKEPGPYFHKYMRSKAIQDNGKALWPDYFPLSKKDALKLLKKYPEQYENGAPPESLEEKKNDAGSLIFGAQYQNDTSAMEGHIFKAEFLKGHVVPEDIVEGVQTYDLAITTKESSDYTAHILLGRSMDNRLHVMQAYRDKISFNDTKDLIISRYRTSPVDVSRIGIEAIAYQQAMSDTLIEETYLPITAIKPTKDKHTRALPLSALFENGKLRLTRGEGVDTLREELLQFPYGDHDDLIDALGMAVSLLQESGGDVVLDGGYGGS